MVRNSVSRTSTISAQEHQLTLTEDDFMVMQRKMDKIDQGLDKLYKNWHAEYRDAVSVEDGEEIRKFYKPYLEKYESKYMILYHLLQQSGSFSTQEPTSEVTPSLAALDNAQALSHREWIRSEPREDVPQQYSTIDGHLTPTLPKPEDMRLELCLNVTLGGSLGDLPNAVNAEETREREHQIPVERPQRIPFETPIEVSPETHVKAKPKSNIREAPRRIQRTREASREDAIASTCQFFAAVHERNRDTAAEEPIVTSPDRNKNDVAIPSNIRITPDIHEAEDTETETRSPRTFLPSGSPSRHTATDTC